MYVQKTKKGERKQLPVRLISKGYSNERFQFLKGVDIMKKSLLAVITATVLAVNAVPLSAGAFSAVPAENYQALAEETKFEAENFFVAVGTYSGATQLRYFAHKADGGYTVDKVVWEDAPANISYGDVFIADGEVSMTKVMAAPNDPGALLKQFIAEQKDNGNYAFSNSNVYSQEDFKDNEGSIPEPFKDKIVVEYLGHKRREVLESVKEFMENNNISEDLVFFIELQ